jgi:hypothetical protein
MWESEGELGERRAAFDIVRSAAVLFQLDDLARQPSRDHTSRCGV